MTIKRGGIRSLDNKERETISLCPKCEKVGLRELMKDRIYLPDEFGRTIIPGDAHLWKQCYRCGLVLPIYNLKKEGRLTSELTITSPFDKGKTVVINLNNRKAKRGKSELDYTKDPDIKRDLASGGTLVSYTES